VVMDRLHPDACRVPADRRLGLRHASAGGRFYYLLGMCGFALASAACGSPPPRCSILTRLFKVLSAALLTPGSMAICKRRRTRRPGTGPIEAWVEASAVLLSPPGRWSAATEHGPCNGGGSSHQRPRSRPREWFALGYGMSPSRVTVTATGKIDYAGAIGRGGVPERQSRSR